MVLFEENLIVVLVYLNLDYVLFFLCKFYVYYKDIVLKFEFLKVELK